jgi:hypothetical protein
MTDPSRAIAIACSMLMPLALAAAAGGPAHAQSSGPGCFHISYANQGAAPATAIRWNSCTGETWLLLKQGTTDKDGKPDGSVWGWFPIIISKSIASSPN